MSSGTSRIQAVVRCGRKSYHDAVFWGVTSKFRTVTVSVFVDNERYLVLNRLSTVVVCLHTKYYVAEVGTENSERAGRCLRVRNAGISSQPFILKGSGSNNRPCSHLMDLLCAAELCLACLSTEKKKDR